MNTAAQYCLLSIAVIISFRTLSVAEGFKIVGDLFVNLAFEDFRNACQDGYRSITVWV